MSFDSEDSEIYYIAEENDDSHLSTSQREYVLKRRDLRRRLNTLTDSQSVTTAS